MKIVAVVQARMKSTRLPKKVMRLITDRPMIELILLRLSKSKLIDQVIVATSEDATDDVLAEQVKKLRYKCFRGSEDDVLGRFYFAAHEAQADIIVRITGDCPLIDPDLVDAAITQLTVEGVDYLSNVSPPTFPDGLDTEVFTFRALEHAHAVATSMFDREHVTPFLRNSRIFTNSTLRCEQDYSTLRWTVDEEADLKVVSRIFSEFAPNIHFSWVEVLSLHQTKPELFDGNRQLERNMGAQMGTGQKLWHHAKNIIPGGNMLLSKRAEMFAPQQWPSYFNRAKGCEVWDLDNRRYIDVSLMGVGTNTLGYGHPAVDTAVLDAVAKGNMSTLNCPEEVYLADRLVELHPWADMVKFARTGGEANAVAIRIARAAANRDNIAVCGYHGWHDWYLSANLGDADSLAGHLLPGLEPLGVPSTLRGTVHTFSYNDYEGLERLVSLKNIGIIKMEVVRNQTPENDFLKRVRKLASERGIVLIFDECTSGFRENFGGLHLLYGVEPDLAVFGKALGNGYAVTAIIGRREIMEAAQSTFISSTFWTERIGSSAALKTLEVMEAERSWERITAIGRIIQNGWKEIADRHGIYIKQSGLPALAGFSFGAEKNLQYKTFITQEMLKKGFLASTSIYASLAHTQHVVESYLDALDEVFLSISRYEDKRETSSMLDGPVCHSGFQRLN